MEQAQFLDQSVSVNIGDKNTTSILRTGTQQVHGLYNSGGKRHDMECKRLWLQIIILLKMKSF